MIQTGIIAVTPDLTSASWQSLGGPALLAAAHQHGLKVTAEALVPPLPDRLTGTLLDFSNQGCQVVLVLGGCGTGPDDVTPQTCRALAGRELPAFGETIRRHLHPESPDFLDRSLAVLTDHTLILVLPRSTALCLTVLTQLAPAIHRSVQLLSHGRAAG
jgi:molybdopterin biosynthesis enzyme MoaB